MENRCKTILVVDDDKMICALLTDLLEDQSRTVISAFNANAALEELSKSNIDVVLTDVNMPGMDGIGLMDEIKKIDPDLPVIVMTGFGSEDIAIKALKGGAFNFCRKPFNIDEITKLVCKGIELKAYSDEQKEILPFLNISMSFHMPSDVNYIRRVISHIAQGVKQLGFPENDFNMRVKLALDEGLTNAILHGNKDDKTKHVEVETHISPEKLEIKIIDQGEGFDVTRIPDPKDPANLHKEGGRGVLLMGYYMDELRYNEKGNEVIIIKYYQNGINIDHKKVSVFKN